MIWKRIVVREMERALMFVNGQLQAVEGPGVYRMFSLWRGLEVEVVSTLETVPRPALAEVLLRSASALVEANFVRVVVGEGRVAVVFADGLLVRVLSPGESALIWRVSRAIEVREFDIVAEAEATSRLAVSISLLRLARSAAILITSVPTSISEPHPSRRQR